MADPGGNARLAAYEVLGAVEARKAFADRALDGVLRRQTSLGERDRALTTEIVYGVLRRRGTLDQALARHLRRPLHRMDPEVRRILRIGAYQILFLDRVPDHAAVSESVDLAHARARPGAGSLVNAVLRALCRQKDPGGPEGGEGRSAAPGFPAEVDFPEWLTQRWREQLGEARTRSLLERLLRTPARVLRASTLRADPDRVAKRLASEGFPNVPVPGVPDALVLCGGGDVRGTGCYREGWCVQQDAASQLVVGILDPRPGECVLDLCAAPGIKTGQAAQRMENRGRIVAADVHRSRLRELVRLGERLGSRIVVPLHLDAAAGGGLPFRPDGFDRVLVDAPCSGLGVLGRNPERKWRPPPDFEALAALQAKMLDAASGVLRAGGVLVYCTCTVNRTENEDVVEGFLQRHRAFVRESVTACLPEGLRGLATPDGDLATWQEDFPFDLFYAARLRRAG